MKDSALYTLPLCVPCLARTALRLIELSGADAKSAEELLRFVMQDLSQVPYDVPAPVHTGRLFAHIARRTGVADPFAAAKQRATTMALDLLPRYEQRVNSDKNPFATAIRLAIAGNVIDLATRDDVPESELLTVIEKTLAAALPTTTLESLEQAISSASRILFLADNAGEIVFDRPLLNLLPRDKITLAVRGGPILNDATLVEARASGLQDLVSIVDNGSAIPGTWLPDCSEEFQRIYDQADLLISKGQGNFETLWGRTSIPTFFLFRVKCEGIQARVHSPVDTDMLLQG